MGVVGNFGKAIVFQVGTSKDGKINMLIPQGIQQQTQGRWSMHELIGQRPLAEFNGPGITTFTFRMVLDSTLGYKPHKTMYKLHRYIETGANDILVFNGVRIGKRWRMTNMSEAWDIMYGGGELSKVSVDVTLEDYR